MDSHSYLVNKLHFLLLLVSLVCIQIKAEDGSGSVFFLDGQHHQFFRTHFSERHSSMSVSDAGAAVSVLLGVAPPANLSSDSLSKLNTLISPDPFTKPSAVIMVEIQGIEQDANMFAKHLATTRVGSSITSKLLPVSTRAAIELPEDEVSVIALDESSGSECDAVCISEELQNFAFWLGGSYVSSAEEPLDGLFSVTLASGSVLKLNMAKKADREFLVNVISLVRNIRKAMEIHEGLPPSMHSLPELMTGCFTGIKALQEQYGSDGVSQQGMELLFTTLAKLFSSLEDAYQGEVVGVFVFAAQLNQESESIFSVKLTSQRSSRWLGESESPIDSIVEVLLVRRILAWTTGIILLISTLIGVYFLLNMPLTRDTLLYSNVKLD